MSKAEVSTTLILPRRAVVAGIASAAALPIAAAVPVSAAAITDPVFAAIDAHRQAQAAADSKFAEAARMSKLADAKVGPSYIEIPSMVEPGTTVQAAYWSDIQRAVPPAEFPDLYGNYNRLLDERRAARSAITCGTEQDEFTDDECEAVSDALYDLARTVPTTVAGLLAMAVYAGDIWEREKDAYDAHLVVASLATAAKALQQPLAAG